MSDLTYIWDATSSADDELRYHRWSIIDLLHRRIDNQFAVPAFLIISQERRHQAWIEYDRRLK
jgi:hypothetical protein